MAGIGKHTVSMSHTHLGPLVSLLSRGSHDRCDIVNVDVGRRVGWNTVCMYLVHMQCTCILVHIILGKNEINGLQRKKLLVQCIYDHKNTYYRTLSDTNIVDGI